MALTVQNIVDATSSDIRKVVGNTGTDAALILGWVDRIHKDVLHSSFYSYLSRQVLSVTTTAGATNYTMVPATPIRRITMVFDRVANKPLLPMDEIHSTGSTEMTVQGTDNTSGKPKAILSTVSMRPWPEYYKQVGATSLYIFPAPVSSNYAGTLEVHYDTQVTTLANLTDVLVVPEDGKDILVAGVNSLAFQYLKLDVDAMYWTQLYERMKLGEPRT